MIPEGWQEVNVGNVISDLKSGLSRKLSTSDIGLPMIRSTNITDQGLDCSEIKYWYRDDPQGASTENYYLQDGDILVNFINSIAQIGKSAMYHDELKRDTIYTTNLFRVRVNNRILANYFLLVTKTTRYNHYIYSITKPAVNQASFTTEDFQKFCFPLPPLPEQRAIAAILGTWDKAIALAERRLAAAEQRKKALMQQLLTGRVRFPEFAGEAWRKMRLRQILNIQYGKSPNSIRDESGIYNIYGTGGIVGKTNETLCEKPAVIIGRKGTIDRPQLAKAPFWTIDTTYYSVPQGKINVDWIYYTLSYLSLERYNEASGVPSLSRNTLYNIKIMVPAIEEQRRIAAVLQTCDREIDLLTQKRDALQRQKKGLMQRLLTGRVRVKV